MRAKEDAAEEPITPIARKLSLFFAAFPFDAEITLPFRIEKSLLQLFGLPALKHSGGCLIAYGLFKDVGKLVASDTIGGRSAYLDSRPEISVE